MMRLILVALGAMNLGVVGAYLSSTEDIGLAAASFAAGASLFSALWMSRLGFR